MTQSFASISQPLQGNNALFLTTVVSVIVIIVVVVVVVVQASTNIYQAKDVWCV